MERNKLKELAELLDFNLELDRFKGSVDRLSSIPSEYPYMRFRIINAPDTPEFATIIYENYTDEQIYKAFTKSIFEYGKYVNREEIRKALHL